LGGRADRRDRVLVGSDGRQAMATERAASIGLRPDDLVEAWFEGVQLIHVPAYSLFLIHSARPPGPRSA
jgi:hypothetical protein